jgi:hypothetical protein
MARIGGGTSEIALTLILVFFAIAGGWDLRYEFIRYEYERLDGLGKWR